MRLYCCVLPAAVLATTVSSAHCRELDNSKISFREFLASGLANMAALISWLQGYHAGKTGIIPFESSSPYGGRLGPLQAAPGRKSDRRLRAKFSRSWMAISNRSARPIRTWPLIPSSGGLRV